MKGNIMLVTMMMTISSMLMMIHVIEAAIHANHQYPYFSSLLYYLPSYMLAHPQGLNESINEHLGKLLHEIETILSCRGKGFNKCKGLKELEHEACFEKVVLECLKKANIKI